jgi:hypothetical protein
MAMIMTTITADDDDDDRHYQVLPQITSSLFVSLISSYLEPVDSIKAHRGLQPWRPILAGRQPTRHGRRATTRPLRAVARSPGFSFYSCQWS